MKSQKGFIQIPILIAIMAGVLILGGAGYVGVKQYQDREAEKISKKEQNRDSARIADLEKKLIELEKLQSQEKNNKDDVLQKESDPIQPKLAPTSSKKLSNTEIIAKVKPAIVYIKTPLGSGSGFIIESDGYILTNAHVVDKINRADITFSNGDYSLANIVARNELYDLALLKVNRSGLSKLALGSSDENSLLQGEDVFTFGFPFGIEGDVSFKEGTISRRLKEGKYLEISAEIHPGNSGGPLVNRYGAVVGINTAIYSSQQIEGVILGETIKLAIPVDTVKTELPRLKTGKNLILPDISGASNNSPSAPICVYTEIQKQNYLDFMKNQKAMADYTLRGGLNMIYAIKKISNSDFDGAISDLNKALDYFDKEYAVALGIYKFISDDLPVSIKTLMRSTSDLSKEAISYARKEAESEIKKVEDLKLGGYNYVNLSAEVERNNTMVQSLSEQASLKMNELKPLAQAYFCE